MINYSDQMDLFKLISKDIKRDFTCFAFGGTAMMFYGFKDDTKDIDLLFEDEQSRSAFIETIEEEGFEESSPSGIYIPEKLRDKHKPLMLKKGEIRFDLFFGKIFRTQLSQKMREDKYAVHDFKDKHLFRVNVLRTEHLVLLKSLTSRDKDFEDIITIIRKDKRFDWEYLVDEAIWQHENGDSWILLDLEETMTDLKEYTLIESKHFSQIYAAQKGGKKGQSIKSRTGKISNGDTKVRQRQ